MWTAPEIDVDKGGGDVSKGGHDVENTGDGSESLWTAIWWRAAGDVKVAAGTPMEAEGDVAAAGRDVDGGVDRLPRMKIWVLRAKEWRPYCRLFSGKRGREGQ